MLTFANDYSEGVHESILKRLSETNLEQLPGYGADCYSESARAKLRALCAAPEADIYFLMGGTQTNVTVIDTMLAPWQGALAASTGHINVHEAGALEWTGHKILTLPAVEGKLPAASVKHLLDEFFSVDKEQRVFPGVVYITHPTEYGTLYTKQELADLAAVCAPHHIPIYVDGARLGYGLMSDGTDVTLPVLAQYCDAFFVGGTKVGALCGEAVVFPKHNAPQHFIPMMKQHGALLDKGRLLGLQFDTLFTDGLYFKIARHAIEMASLLKAAFQAKGYRFLMPPQSNQLFIILENRRMQELKSQIGFNVWEKYDDTHTVARFVTSWATTPENVQKLIDIL